MTALENVHIIAGGIKNILTDGGKIISITDVENETLQHESMLRINFENAIAFPGLINSHDHLDFNLFPRLGNRVYNNYTEWGKDIHAQNKKEIAAVNLIPQALRIKWGIYKNLLAGVTTVVNHGEYLNIEEPLVNVFQECYSLHSVQFEKWWKQKLNNPFTKNIPFVIHAGEGTDDAAKNEIDELIKWNLFKRKLIAVHGVAMNAEQANHFDALVWCPDSNYFLLNQTAKIDELKQHTKIIFGTDSTLTACWNIWDHLRLARSTRLLSDAELFDSVTTKPAAVWGLERTGKIDETFAADIVVAKRKDIDNEFDSFFELNPEDILLVLHNGEIRLFDESLTLQLMNSILEFDKFSRVFINGSCKYIAGDLSGLSSEVIKYNSSIIFPLVNPGLIHFNL